MNRTPLLQLDDIPVYQNKMFASAGDARACPRGRVRLVQHPLSGLVSNDAFDPTLLTYDATYQNEQGHSSSFQAHMARALEIVRRNFAGLGTLEIGCGKGLFLEQMRASGLEATGIDAAYEGSSPHVMKRHFGPGATAKSDAIVMRHVLEHIPDPFAMLSQVKAANGGDGLIYIEVPCLDWILSNNAWFDIFYEHVNYFRLDDFQRMFGDIVESGRLFGDQYLYIVARLESLRDPSAERPGDFTHVRLPGGFLDAIDESCRMLAGASASAVWGAAAKGVMFTHHLAARGFAPDVAIDINPAKQGHFLAGSAIPVHSPESARKILGNSPTIFVMNSNYMDEIRSQFQGSAHFIAVDRK